MNKDIQNLVRWKCIEFLSILTNVYIIFFYIKSYIVVLYLT